MKTVKTLKGTELPLTNLKGKDYLMVAYRLQWLSEDVERYDISTELVLVTDEQTVARATVSLYNKEGILVRKAQATKRETKKDFPDHTEKAETAAIGRALAMLGFGTQHALADLDEGNRLADSPLQAVGSKDKKESFGMTTHAHNDVLQNDELLEDLKTNNRQQAAKTLPPETKTEPEAPKQRTTFRRSTPPKVIHTELANGSSNGTTESWSLT